VNNVIPNIDADSPSGAVPLGLPCPIQISLPYPPVMTYAFSGARPLTRGPPHTVHAPLWGKGTLRAGSSFDGETVVRRGFKGFVVPWTPLNVTSVKFGRCIRAFRGVWVPLGTHSPHYMGSLLHC